MSNEQTKNIDRMVDGELDRAAERQLLLQCETNNEWRQLALAFVESRALKLEMKSLLETASKPEVDAVAPKTTTTLPAKSYWDFSIWSLAAAVLLSLGLGYGMGWGWQRTNFAAPDIAANSPVEGSARGTVLPPSMQFFVKSPSTRELQQVEIPLLRATDLGPNWRQRLQDNSSEELVREMQRRGLNLRQERTITPVRLSNGQRVVVPVDYFYEQPYQ